MAFANANIQPKGTTTPVVQSATPVAGVSASINTTQKSTPALLPKKGAKKIHTYKIVLTAIISSIAAFSLQSMYNSRFTVELKEYYVSNTYAPVDLDAIARARTLSEADVLQLALEFERRLQDAEVQAVLQELQAMEGVNYEQWPQVKEAIVQKTAQVQLVKTTEFINDKRLSDEHIAQITAARSAEGFVKPELNPIQITAVNGVQEFKKGTRSAMATAYVQFKVDAELGYELATQISTEFERLLPPEQIAGVQRQLEDALLAAGIVPKTVAEDLQAAAPEEVVAEVPEEVVVEEVDPLKAVGVAEVVEVVQVPVVVNPPIVVPEPVAEVVPVEPVTEEAVEEPQSSSSSSYFRVNKRALRENFDWYQKRFE